MKQTDMVLRHLRDCGSISSLEAFREYGITRLAARIHDLRKQGWDIDSADERKTNRYGGTVKFARYILLA
jgi:hypothetical protein